MSIEKLWRFVAALQARALIGLCIIVFGLLSLVVVAFVMLLDRLHWLPG